MGNKIFSQYYQSDSQVGVNGQTSGMHTDQDRDITPSTVVKTSTNLWALVSTFLQQPGAFSHIMSNFGCEIEKRGVNFCQEGKQLKE